MANCFHPRSHWHTRTGAALLLGAAMLSGCFTSSVVVTVRPDGSATVEQRASIRPAAMIAFQQLASPGTAPSATDAAALAREFQQDLDKAARTLRLRNLARMRLEPVNTPEAMGWVLSYDVDDVTGIDLDLMPQLFGMNASYSVPIAAKDHGAGASTRLKISMEPIAGGLQRLTVHFPRFALDPAAEPPAAWATGSPAEMAALQKLMGGSRITVAVESASPIVGTNSPFRQDNRVTLLDADLEQAVFSKQIGTLATTPATFRELLDSFADLPGVTLARDPDIWIDVENPSAHPAPVSLPSAASSTDTEIFLAPLVQSNGDLAVGAPINITNNPGYDNQPSFSPDGRQILFASARGRGNQASRAAIPPTDIYRYEIASRTVWRITNTPEAEFSPGVMPDGKNISVVRVERDGSQRLWRVPNDNSEKGPTTVVFRDLKPIGCYAWMSERTAALLVLGERRAPATLQMADTAGGSAQKIAADIGRTIQRMPSGPLTFAQRPNGTGNGGAIIRRVLKTEDGAFTTEPIVQLPFAVSDPPFTWMPDGTLLTAIDDVLYEWRGQPHTWKAVAYLANFGLHHVSQIVASPQGDRLAIVSLAK